jgi:hypothetical protein
VTEEVFILEGIYVDPDFDKEKEYGPGSYLYYSPGSDYYATSPTGYTFLVMNAKNSEKIVCKMKIQFEWLLYRLHCTSPYGP